MCDDGCGAFKVVGPMGTRFIRATGEQLQKVEDPEFPSGNHGSSHHEAEQPQKHSASAETAL